MPGFLTIVPCHRGSTVRKPRRNRFPELTPEAEQSRLSAQAPNATKKDRDRPRTDCLVAVGTLWATKRSNMAATLRQYTLPRPAVA